MTGDESAGTGEWLSVLICHMSQSHPPSLDFLYPFLSRGKNCSCMLSRHALWHGMWRSQRRSHLMIKWSWVLQDGVWGSSSVLEALPWYYEWLGGLYHSRPLLLTYNADMPIFLILYHEYPEFFSVSFHEFFPFFLFYLGETRHLRNRELKFSHVTRLVQNSP